MSKKKTIEDQEKELQQREEQVKEQLDNDSDDLKEKLVRVGKIAAVSGAAVLVGYWIYRSFLAEDEPEEEITEKPKAKRKSSGMFSAAISSLIIPYLQKLLDGFFDEKNAGAKKANKG